MAADTPILWYVNRSTGLVLVVLLTATVLLGIASARPSAGAGGRIPLFVRQALHRNLSLLTVTLLALHVSSAVVDEYVDIRWWHAFVPLDLRYQPIWLAQGVVALDLVLAVILTSLLRSRLVPLLGRRGGPAAAHRLWSRVHLISHAAWVVALVHGLGIGTDSGAGWVRSTYAGCALAVILALALRLARGLRRRPRSPVVLTAAPHAHQGAR